MRRQSKLYSQWSTEIKRAGLFRTGERVGVAVSGGQDSILLHEFLTQFATHAGFELAVVHFNHRLRGKESDQDEAFVAGLASSRKQEFIRAGADPPRAAQRAPHNLEATARELRYGFFFSLLRQGRLDKIATAHTANDQAETVLMRLLRGAGTRGLGGIHPALDGVILRPFLGVTRREVEAEVCARKLRFQTDSSNSDLRFLRNRIRLKLLPLLEAEFNPAIVLHLAQLASHVRNDEVFLDHQAREQARPWRIRDGDAEKVPVEALRLMPPALQVRVLRQMAASVLGKPPGLSSLQVESILRLARSGESGKHLVMGGLEVRRDFDCLMVHPVAVQKQEPEPYCYPISVPGRLELPALGVAYRFEVGENPEKKAYNQDTVVTRLDMGKIKGSLTLRSFRAGDRLRLVGRLKSRKLKTLFQELQIPATYRKLWPVIEDQEGIIWVRNFPLPQAAAATPETLVTLTIAEEPLPAPRNGGQWRRP
jgi:tRNA(Ile)-lysidine synthase